MLRSGESLKILGFYFGPTKDAEAHVKNIERKVCSRLRILWHLKRTKVPQVDIAALYRTLVRSVINYATPTYSSLLTEGQSKRLECLQMWAFKIGYGFKVAYNTVLLAR